jgi:Cysteinyl-tRNA synthetase
MNLIYIGGGRDLIFPHHENEIAQSRCANGTKSFANYWVHNGFITLSNEKMAKSQGNILKIKDFKTKYNGQVLRLALMTSHYRQGLDWNDKLISECEKTLTKWYSAHIEVKERITVSDDILSPLYDDLNTPGYIANLHSLYFKASSGTDEDKNIFVSACNFIGLLTDTKEEWMSFKKNSINISEDEIRSKIEERNKARSDKNYELADKIRQDLLDKGILIEDKDGTTSWKLK